MSAFQSGSVVSSNTSLGVRISGSSSQLLGSTVAGVGDVNGDGYADFMIGTTPAGPTIPPASAYVVFGKAGGWSNLNVGQTDSSVMRITGLANDFNNRISISSAGDVDGDGYSDLLLGTGLGGTANQGATYVITGHGGDFADIDLTVSTTGVSLILGGAAGDYTGRSVAAAGDFNGDGFADIIIGGQNYVSYAASTGFAGSAYVVFGSRDGIGNLDLSAAGASAFRIDGAAGDNLGRIVAGVGDLNGDGLADVATAGSVADPPGRVDGGVITVIFGKTTGFFTLNVGGLGSGGFRITGAAANNMAGSSIASAGDINGDGYGDLIVGAPLASTNGRTNNGSAYVIFGHAGGFADIDLADLGAAGFRIDGAESYHYVGSSASTAGDVNGDGYADLLLGAENAIANGARGRAYLLLGHDGAFGNLDLASPDSYSAALSGSTTTDGLGKGVSPAGDADGDGFADIVIGANGASGPSSGSGAAFVLFSQSQGGATYRGTTLADTLRGTPDSDALNGYGQDDHLYGNAGNDTLDGGPGTDNMVGGPGDDTYLIDDQTDAVAEQAGEGNDTAWVSASGSISIGPNVEIIRLWGAANQFGGSGTAEQIVANAVLASTIHAGAGQDTIWGNSLTNGLNNFQGGEGDDIIRGQDGNGDFIGGQGNDQYVIGNATARIVELANQGIDTAWVVVNDHTLDPNVEILRLGGTAFRVFGSEGDEQLVANPLFGSGIDARGGNDVIWGSTLSGILNGGTGDDIIRNQGGADTMLGGSGNDQFTVLNNNAVLVENPSEGDDTAWVAVNGYAVGANIERINLSGLANTAIGNASDNIIAGNPLMGNTYLVGGGGSDIIFGSSFVDAFRGDVGNDILYSLGGADRFIYQGPGWGYDQINGFTQGAAKLDFTGTGIAFGQLFIQSANGNSQVEYGGSAILVFGVSSLTAADFLF